MDQYIVARDAGPPPDDSAQTAEFSRTGLLTKHPLSLQPFRVL